MHTLQSSNGDNIYLTNEIGKNIIIISLLIMNNIIFMINVIRRVNRIVVRNGYCSALIYTQLIPICE
jgi:hypothetical protein